MIEIEGELDIDTATGIEQPLRAAAMDQDRALVVDLTNCVFIDSAGLAALLHGVNPMQNGGSNAVVVCPDGPVRHLLQLTAIDQTVRVFGDFDAAREAALAND